MPSLFIKNFRFLVSCLGHILPGALVQIVLGKRYPDFRNDEFNICIEGFQRSGNTFFVALFQRWNPDIRIAHHTHLASTPLYAIKREVPTIILLREPLDVAVSIMNWDSRLRAEVVLIAYSMFYKMLWRKKSEMLVLRFSDATQRPEECIALIKRRFGMELNLAPFTDTTRTAIFDIIHKKDSSLERNQFSSSLPNSTKDAASKKNAPKVVKSCFYPMSVRTYKRFENLAVDLVTV